jgi:hypothetical protein
VAVPWGHYGSDIAGGTGKFKDATDFIDYFGMADSTKVRWCFAIAASCVTRIEPTATEWFSSPQATIISGAEFAATVAPLYRLQIQSHWTPLHAGLMPGRFGSIPTFHSAVIRIQGLGLNSAKVGSKNSAMCRSREQTIGDKASSAGAEPACPRK